MEEERDVHVGHSLPQHAREQQEVIIMDDYDVTRLVDLDNLISELQVGAEVVCPFNALRPAIIRLVLLVVEEGIDRVFGISPPSGLIIQSDTIVACFGVISEPHRNSLDTFIMG